jgi:hypothetical protein
VLSQARDVFRKCDPLPSLLPDKDEGGIAPERLGQSSESGSDRGEVLAWIEGRYTQQKPACLQPIS